MTLWRFAYKSWSVPPFNGRKPSALMLGNGEYRPLFCGLWIKKEQK